MSRLPHAVVAALALHGLLLLVHGRPAYSATPATGLDVQAIELVEEPPAEEPPARDATLAQPPPDGRVASESSVARAARSSALAGGHEAGPVGSTKLDSPGDGEPVANVASEPAASSSTEPAPRKIDLGLDGHFFMRPPSEELPRVRKSGAQRALEASIAADDVRHGLARGNVSLGSLNAAVRDSGPVRGDSLLRVTVGADGSFSALELVQGKADDWASALNLFRELASRKRVRIPPGARGLRVTFSVKAKVQLPSGAEVKGVDVASPSLAPNGLTLHGTFDVADLGAGSQRMVYAHIVSEEVL